MVEANLFIEADLFTVLAFMKAIFVRDDEVACVGGCRGLVLISAANEGMRPTRPNVPFVQFSVHYR